MECKSFHANFNPSEMQELIDTLWNVNSAAALIVELRSRELIDTLWNVNVSGFLTRIIRGCGINRYIMECKYTKQDILPYCKGELIDTLWNVNTTYDVEDKETTWN